MLSKGIRKRTSKRGLGAGVSGAIPFSVSVEGFFGTGCGDKYGKTVTIERRMGCHPNGEQSPVYALVIYIPDPLGKFLDELRRELVPGCNPHAHVSVLPPRPLAVDWEEASQFARELAE